MKRFLILSTLLILLSSWLRTGQLSPVRALFGEQSTAKIDASLQTELASLAATDQITVIVTLEEQAKLPKASGSLKNADRTRLIQGMQSSALSAQKQVADWLAARSSQGAVSQIIPFWIFNGFSVTATPQVIQELAARPDVRRITPDTIDIVPVGHAAAGTPEANIALINAPALWNLGYFGQGIVIASMDSGVDLSHPEIATRWRGGSNSWYDPYNQHPATPFDNSGHGTWTMGVMVGSDAGGNAIGVAPQASWVAVKIFNDAGTASATAIHQGFQWVLDPDGDPYTADAPQVVNNSWAFGSSGCNLDFQMDLQALRAAGILPVFSAGNYGPNASTDASPGNYPEAFAVGAINNLGVIDTASSRGPSACGETTTTYPELVAPGVNIRTTDLQGFYTLASGTSLAAPHVSGALALLLSVEPNLGPDQLQTVLLNTAVDLGSPGPDNDYGYGKLDILAAYQLVASGTIPTSTPTPTLPPPTATLTPLPVTPSPTYTAAPPTVTPMPTSQPTVTIASKSYLFLPSVLQQP